MFNHFKNTQSILKTQQYSPFMKLLGRIASLNIKAKLKTQNMAYKPMPDETFNKVLSHRVLKILKLCCFKQ